MWRNSLCSVQRKHVFRSAWLAFCRALWFPHCIFTMSDLERNMTLERIQCSMARRILSAPWDILNVNLLAELGWPTLRWRREIARRTLLHSVLLSRPTLLAGSLSPFVSSTNTSSFHKPYRLLLSPAKSSRHVRSSIFCT